LVDSAAPNHYFAFATELLMAHLAELIYWTKRSHGGRDRRGSWRR